MRLGSTGLAFNSMVAIGTLRGSGSSVGDHKAINQERLITGTRATAMYPSNTYSKPRPKDVQVDGILQKWPQ